MENTTNLNLAKLASTDTFPTLLSDFNGNMDKIDAAYEIIGTRSSSGALTVASVPASTWTNVCTLTLGAGIYVVTADAEYGSATDGIRILLLDTTETTQYYSANSVLGAGRAILSKTRIFVLPVQTTLYLRVYHTSASTFNIRGVITAVRIA